MNKKISILIDNKEVLAELGSTILETAIKNNIDIPYLCYDPRLKPEGACRLCIVEIIGINDPVASCSYKITQRIEVKTNSPHIYNMRRDIIELILENHDSSCMTCDNDGNCKLQDLAYKYNVNGLSRTSKNNDAEFCKTDPAIEFNNDKCIKCGKCAQICNDVQNNGALYMHSRGMNSHISTAFACNLENSSCEHCGQCISVCPTGAIREKKFKGVVRNKDLTLVKTTCPYCGVGCQINLNVDKRINRIIKVTSDINYIPNNGNLCIKGKFGMDFVSDKKRLTDPLIKKNGEFHKVSWNEAIEYIAKNFKEIIEKYGNKSIAGLASAKCTNEDNFVFQKFFRTVFKNNNIDHCARLCHSSSIAGLRKSIGSGAMTNSIEEFNHCDCIFIIGSNTTEAHPIISLKIKEAVKNNNTKLIVADPRRIDIAKIANIYIQQSPGSDVALINSMLYVIIKENLIAKDYIKNRTSGYEDIAKFINGKFSPENTEKITGISPNLIRSAARLYAKSEKSSIVYSMGITQHISGTDNVLSLANLALLCGKIGKPSTGINPLRGQNNVQGACDMGALPSFLPGYQSLDDANIIKKFNLAWNTNISTEQGTTATELMEKIEGDKIKALYIMGENPAMSDPNLNETKKMLKKCEFIVSQDIFLTETSEVANVILPSKCFAEKDGTFTSTERRINRVRKAVKAPGNALDDWKIVTMIAKKMNYRMEYLNSNEIIKEIASLIPSYSGINYKRISKVGLQWPCTNNNKGTQYLHNGKFPNGLGIFHIVDYKNPGEMIDDNYPFIITTGRELNQFHTGTMSRKSEIIHQLSPYCSAEINKFDAIENKIKTNDIIEIATKRGKILCKVKITSRIKKGLIFIPFHYSENPANKLTNDKLDSVSKIPEFKYCAGKIKKI